MMLKTNYFFILLVFTLIIPTIFTEDCDVSYCKDCYSSNSFILIIFKSLFIEVNVLIAKKAIINLLINVMFVQLDAAFARVHLNA